MPSAWRACCALVQIIRVCQQALAMAAATLPRFKPPQPAARSLAVICAAVTLTVPVGFGTANAVMGPAGHSYPIAVSAATELPVSSVGKLHAQLAAAEVRAELHHAAVLAHRRHLRHLRLLAAERAAAQAAAQASQEPPTPTPTPPSPPAPGGSVTPSSAFEACVIARESGGNPTAVNPSSGAGGLYQFLPSTWASIGYAGQYPGGAQTAPPAVQQQAFDKLYAEAGTSPWASDGCA